MAPCNVTMTALPADENRGPGLLALAWIEAVVALCFVGGRFYCRGLVLHNLGRDDWTILLAFILSVASTVCITVGISLGLGRHTVYLQPEQVHAVLKFMTVDEPFVTLSTCLGKISVCFLLLRITQGGIMDSTRRMRIFIWALIISLFLLTLGCPVINFAGCTPVWKIWEGMSTDPNCWDPHIHLYINLIQSAYACITDLILAILPYFIIRRLQMDPKLKAGLISLLSLGVFAAAVALVKTIELHNIVGDDLTWDLSYLTTWLPTEQYVIIVAACSPTLKPLFTRRPSTSITVSNGDDIRHIHSLYTRSKAPSSRITANSDSSFDEITLQDPSPTPANSISEDLEEKIGV